VQRQESCASLDVRESHAYCAATNFAQFENAVIPPKQPEADGMVIDVGLRAPAGMDNRSHRGASIVAMVEVFIVDD